MNRYEALQRVADLITEDDVVVAISLGRTKSEWYSLMPGDGTMFLPLMGGPMPFGLGVALGLPHRRVLVLDTDGSNLFDPSALCTLANERPSNLTVLVLDNEMYESVGGHPSATSRTVDLERLAAGAGIPVTATARSPHEVSSALSDMLSDGEVGYAVAKVEPGTVSLPPDKEKVTDSIEDKYRFLRHIERIEGISIRPFQVSD
jgi:sulfopyruvate decarboxylase subunit beta